MDMIERVARAIYEKTYPPGHVYHRRDPGGFVGGAEYWLGLACAAIEAMREPTPLMIAAAWEKIDAHKKRAGLGRLGPGPGAVDAWQAMIDAALSTPPEPVGKTK